MFAFVDDKMLKTNSTFSKCNATFIIIAVNITILLRMSIQRRRKQTRAHSMCLSSRLNNIFTQTDLITRASRAIRYAFRGILCFELCRGIVSCGFMNPGVR